MLIDCFVGRGRRLLVRLQQRKGIEGSVHVTPKGIGLVGPIQVSQRSGIPEEMMLGLVMIEDRPVGRIGGQ